jgi:1-acyl-sn-glycerol-3-phosphate acyltransferase
VFDGAVGQLAEEYRREGLAAAVARLDSLRLQDARLRVVTGCCEQVVPLRRLADELLYYGDMVTRDGLGRGSRLALERWKLQPRVEVDGKAWSALERGPFVAFGNHPVGVEIAFFNALLDRDDVYLLAGEHVRQVSSGLGRRVIVLRKTGSLRSRPGRTRLRDRILSEEESSVRPQGDEARGANAAALSSAARLVGRDGAGLHMFPAGTTTRGAVWQRGIGRILAELVDMGRGVTDSVFVVPIVYDVKPIHIVASQLFPARSPLHLLARLHVWAWTGPPAVYIPRPVLLRDLVLDGARSPEALTDALHAMWRSAAAQAREAMQEWTPLRGVRVWLSGRP